MLINNVNHTIIKNIFTNKLTEKSKAVANALVPVTANLNIIL